MYFAPLCVLALAALTAGMPLSAVLSANNDQLSSLNSLLGTVPAVTNLLAMSKNITILAPSNDAFTKMMKEMPGAAEMAKNPTQLTALLQYHVLPGVLMSTAFSTVPKFESTLLMAPFANVSTGQNVELVLENGKAAIFSGFKQMSTVSKADVVFDGGVLHIVDTVLTVPASPSETALDTGLTSLAGALIRANLLAGVNALTDVTIFAPSNAAFKAVGSAAEALSAADLGSLLEYHVLMNQVKFSTDLAMSGMNMSSSANTSMTLNTLLGEPITVRMERNQLFVNSAKVIISDIVIGNGVVHVIDNVLNPMATTATPNPTVATQAPAFSGASSVANDPFTSGIMPTTTIVPATMAVNGGAFAAVPTGALVGAVIGGAAVLANL